MLTILFRIFLHKSTPGFLLREWTVAICIQSSNKKTYIQAYQGEWIPPCDLWHMNTKSTSSESMRTAKEQQADIRKAEVNLRACL